MAADRETSQSSTVDVGDLQSEWLSLRIGEEIPLLQIKEIRKIVNSSRQDNLSGTDYKYIMEATSGKLLKVNSWALWNKIAAVLKESGTTKVTLKLKHPGFEDYSVRVLPGAQS